MSNWEMELKELAPGICVFSQDVEWAEKCSSIVSNELTELFHPGYVVKDYTQVVDTDYRKCSALGLDSALLCDNSDPIHILYTTLEQRTDRSVALFRRKYSMDPVKRNHEWIVLKYGNADFFKSHNDDCFSFPRSLSVVAYFNDNYSGGEISFPFFSISYKPKSGDILLFSSAFPYMHEVSPVLEGERYAAVNWYSYAKL